MARKLSGRSQLLVSFAAYLYAGAKIRREGDSGSRLRSTASSNLVGTVALLLGYVLGGVFFDD